MKKYKYVDNLQGKYMKDGWFAPVVFECVADSILEADKLFLEQTKKDPCKQPNIACIILSGV